VVLCASWNDRAQTESMDSDNDGVAKASATVVEKPQKTLKTGQKGQKRGRKSNKNPIEEEDKRKKQQRNREMFSPNVYNRTLALATGPSKYSDTDNTLGYHTSAAYSNSSQRRPTNSISATGYNAKKSNSGEEANDSSIKIKTCNRAFHWCGQTEAHPRSTVGVQRFG
jgi:hypothetical protein